MATRRPIVGVSALRGSARYELNKYMYVPFRHQTAAVRVHFTSLHMQSHRE